MAWAYYDAAFNIRLASTREQAERLNNGSAVAEVNAADHWQGTLGEAVFDELDQSYYQLKAAIERNE